uniref:Uncharacterized protein n=1 Tax=Spongospora subterranea TaxID=70186 RepID=A0A0H5RKG6_9EUKA|eukprot:CRZ09224.1 hypothetical protein [Spongospora subterranea]
MCISKWVLYVTIVCVIGQLEGTEIHDSLPNNKAVGGSHVLHCEQVSSKTAMDFVRRYMQPTAKEQPRSALASALFMEPIKGSCTSLIPDKNDELFVPKAGMRIPNPIQRPSSSYAPKPERHQTIHERQDQTRMFQKTSFEYIPSLITT